ncbi:MAG: PaaI family thioesterase [Armatimonadetes bacterium]|nr:PaaI family thioesterase [Armatimonadota bacterium]
MPDGFFDLPLHEDCFGCGHPGEERLEPHFRWDNETRRVLGRVRFGKNTQGPPGHAHGGSLSTVLDECMGAAAWISGHPVVCVSLTVNFRNLVPLGSELEMEASVERVDGRKVYASGRLTHPDGQVMAEASGLFLEIPTEMIDNKIPGSQDDITRFLAWKALGA